MGEPPEKSIQERIEECRTLSGEKNLISYLEELLKETKNGLVSYEIGHEYEKIGKIKEAIEYYRKAESLFTETSHKNMARAAINNIMIEDLIHERKKEENK